MRLIGMTGRSGSGKSTVAACARRMGIFVIDCDALYHEMTERPGALLDAIAERFGKETVQNGSLCRPELRKKVFSDQQALEALNRITKQYLTEELQQRLAASEALVALLDAPTLFECGVDELCDRVLGVIAPDAYCLQRICERDGISEQQAALRLQQQKDNAFFEAHCDLLLYNDGSREELERRAESLLASFLREDAS